MPTVRLRDASEYPEPIQKLFEVAKAWFKHDFADPPAMSRVMAWDPELGAFHADLAMTDPDDRAAERRGEEAERNAGPEQQQEEDDGIEDHGKISA